MSDFKRNDGLKQFLGSVRAARANRVWIETAQEDLTQRMDQLRKQSDLLLESEKKVGELLERIPDEIQRTILRLRYLQLLSWPEIQNKLEEQNIYYSFRHLHNIHDKGMEIAGQLWEDGEADGRG